tara:strand:+ start:1779 stop:2969 length:1191 start_codon:yes stop_codon:yes gene_type:complete
MQTNFSDSFLATAKGQRINDIMRRCVHCGFCNASCPTHQVTGNELDGPRGRIYLIKEALEDQTVSSASLQHLDSCLSCLNCETSCPSGVEYRELIDFGKKIILQRVPRRWWPKTLRNSLCFVLTRPRLLKPFYWLARQLKLTPNITQKPTYISTTKAKNPRYLILKGCVQSVAAPSIAEKLQQLLDRADISSQIDSYNHCCGAIEYHNDAESKSLQRIKSNIDNWYTQIENGCEAIIMTASGCGAMIQDYPRLLIDDINYAEKAKIVAKHSLDAAEILSQLPLRKSQSALKNIVFHPPCTLQHAQQLDHHAEQILIRVGYQLQTFKDRHLCCGSAGTYSILHSEMAKKLRQEKLEQLEAVPVELIASANIGCMLHLQKGTQTPVRHWLELIEIDQS